MQSEKNDEHIKILREFASTGINNILATFLAEEPTLLAKIKVKIQNEMDKNKDAFNPEEPAHKKKR